MNNPTNPRISLLDSRFVYVPSAQTDVQRTWRKFGWLPKNDLTLKEVTEQALRILEKEINK